VLKEIADAVTTRDAYAEEVMVALACIEAPLDQRYHTQLSIKACFIVPHRLPPATI
jgi:hypothetical protein